jgi:hypothetical protein
MSSSNLIRWSGLAALVGGVLVVVYDVLDAALFPGEQVSGAMATSSWFIVQILSLVGLVLITLGLVGLYARQVEQGETLGLVAFLVAFIGTVMVSGSVWSEAFIGPVVAEAAPELVGANPSGVVAAGIILAFGLFALGWLLFGLASLRARVLPRGAALLLMVGAVLFFVVSSLEFPGSTIVMGAALVWMGYALWSGTGEAALTAAAAT